MPKFITCPKCGASCKHIYTQGGWKCSICGHIHKE